MRLSQDASAWLCQQPWKGNVRELENLLYRAVVLSEQDMLSREDLMALGHPPAEAAMPTEQYVMLYDAQGRPRTLEEIETDCIASAMRRSSMNVSEAARMLGMGQSTLYKKLQKNEKPAA